MINVPDTIIRRREFSENRLQELTDAFSTKIECRDPDSLAIYITGSYGRLEASTHSDLDIFFLHTGKVDVDQYSRIEKALLDASVIKASRELEFPEFTKGGIYLSIHFLEDMLETLGSPDDDYTNSFTARLLLLLESRPFFGKQIFDKIVYNIIERYFRDYHDHERDFYPVFLVNDITRYWKTMCLNYEHGRNRRTENETEKNRIHLKNLKLKYSRLMTCFSMVAALLEKRPIDPKDIKDLVHLTPVERLNDLALKSKEMRESVENVLQCYADFLEDTGKSEDEVLSWIGDNDNRNLAFNRARQYGSEFYKVVVSAAENAQLLRYLVI